MTLVLHGDHRWISPWVFSAYVGLVEKGLSFDHVEHNLDEKPTRKQPYLERSITGTVPMLEHDGYCIAESLAINEYLAETFPFPKYPVKLFPADLKQRARARQLMMWLRTELVPLRQERSTHAMFYGGGKPMTAAAEASAQELLRVVDLVVADGTTQLFAEWCIADAELAFCLQRLGLCGDALPKKARAYVDAQWSMPSVQKFVRHPRPKEQA